MTPEKRLNQLEPYVAEMSAQLDRVAAQNNTLRVQNQQIIDTLIQHTDSIQFLLRGQENLKTGQENLKTGQEDLKTGQAKLENDVADLKTGQIRLEQNVALLIQLIQKMNGNGHSQ